MALKIPFKDFLAKYPFRFKVRATPEEMNKFMSGIEANIEITPNFEVDQGTELNEAFFTQLEADINAEFTNHNESEQAHPFLRRLIENISLTWDGITGKPTEFPPSTHNHNGQNIINMPDGWKKEADLPNTYPANSITMFKTTTVWGGISAGATVITTNINNGSVIRQEIYRTGNDAYKVRYNDDGGNTTWGEWRVQYDSRYKPTSSDVGLGNVQNYGIATTAEAQAGTSTTKYMTPALVKAAIEELSGVTKYLKPSSNVKQTFATQRQTKASILLGTFIPKYSGCIRITVDLMMTDPGSNAYALAFAVLGAPFDGLESPTNDSSYWTKASAHYNAFVGATPGAESTQPASSGWHGLIATTIVPKAWTTYSYDCRVIAGLPITIVTGIAGGYNNTTYLAYARNLKISYDEVAI